MKDDVVVEGALYCTDCSRFYPIIEEIPIMLPDELRDKKQEEFYVLMLNSKNNIIKEQFIYKGTLNAAIIEPREIFKEALKNSAAKIILIHNHPSGDPSPSKEDVDITKKIKEAGQIVDIKVLDHIIIGNGSWWSWIEKS